MSMNIAVGISILGMCLAVAAAVVGGHYIYMVSQMKNDAYVADGSSNPTTKKTALIVISISTVVLLLGISTIISGIIMSRKYAKEY